PWTTITVTQPCGTQVLGLGLVVQSGNHGWAACFDNVTAVCEPGVNGSQSTWGRIKSLYGG
ncbi:MAG: hypothetical protein KJ645_09050, partial [Planctomycetes bacterium]|nr:hypothetical protein [Planctomycetota bacterium]